MAADCQSFIEAAPSFGRTSPFVRKPMSRPVAAALGIVLAIHAVLIALALRTADIGKRVSVDTILDIALIAAPPPIPPLPQPSPHTVTRIRTPTRAPVVAPTTAPTVHEASPAADTPSVQLFNRDGSVLAPAEPKAAPQPFEADIAKGRELMGRGLSCEGPDALGGHESLGEGVARKYLSWIGMYNPFNAQLRAEQAAERLARCKHWTQPQ